MTFPAIIFSFFVAALFGSLLHLWRGGNLFRFLLWPLFSRSTFYPLFSTGNDQFGFWNTWVLGFTGTWLLVESG